MSLTRVIVVGFASVILVGALLLTLPAASRSGESAGFMTALFTAASATCVTGLVVVDTYSNWTVFGQVVILVLIQTGGLGFMTMASIFSFFLNRRIGMRERLIMVQTLNLNEMDGVVRLVRHVLVGTFVFEAVGAAVLSACFISDYGVAGGIARGIFHAVSAFCNAGFDILGDKVPFSGLMGYSGNLTVNVTVLSLVVIGGLGFFVWEDIFRNRRFSRFRLHTKLVLVITAVLILGGAVFFFFAEYSNPATMGNMSIGERILASFFQSITPRTAGFNTIDENSMYDMSKMFTILLMAIGGSSGSTAGGIKTVTFGIIVIATMSAMKSREDVAVFGRRIPNKYVLASYALAVTAFLLCVGNALVISGVEKIPYLPALFETVSAFGTVGLTTGITPGLSWISQTILIILMFFGRIGIMTIGAALLMGEQSPANVKYPCENVMIG